MPVDMALGALARGFASGLTRRKADEERKAENARLAAVQDAQLEIARINAQTARMTASQPVYGTGGLGISPDVPAPPSGGGGGGGADSGAAAGRYDAAAATAGGPSTFAGLLAKHEGGGRYDTLFGHSQRAGGRFAGVDVSKMTIGEAIAFASPSGPYAQWVKGKVGHVATPMGAGQIVGSTLKRTAASMKLSPDTPFDQATQNRMIDYLAQQRLAGQSTMAGKRAALRAEWEGYKNVPDSQLDQAIIHFENTRGGVPVRGMGTRAL